MILTEVLLAPTVPSEPSPKNTARTTVVGSSVANEGSTSSEAGVGDVVDDPDGEVSFRLRPGQFVEDRRGHGRGELLGRQAVAAADHLGHRRGAAGRGRRSARAATTSR